MDLHIDMAGAAGRTLGERLQGSLREAVRSGRLAAGTRLPSSRALAIELGVSRGVVSDAYGQLVAEGYLHARRGAGTTVASSTQPRRAARTSGGAQEHVRFDLNPFRPALSGFPRATWQATFARVVRGVADEQLGYSDPQGTAALREALASYLGRVRGVRANPDRILITAGVRQSLWLFWLALSQKDSAHRLTVGIESPGWKGIAETATSAGLATAHVQVDEDGLRAETLGERGDIDVVAVAPAHQYPTGAVLAPHRRTALVAWAERTGGMIFEDDYDAEYRYDRKPVGSLQGLAPDHVVYAGSASKAVAPAVRLGWVILPARLVAPTVEIQRRTGGVPSPLDQLTFAELIEKGDLDRHLRRQRNRYRRRRDAVLEALATSLPNLPVRGAAAGLFVVLDLPPGTSERTVIARARAHGIALEGFGGKPNGVVIGYANLDETAAPAAIAALAAVIRETAAVAQPSGCDQRLGQCVLADSDVLWDSDVDRVIAFE